MTAVQQSAAEPSMAYLAAYFRNEDLSDIDIVICLRETQQSQQSDVTEDVSSPPLKRARREADEAADTGPLQLSSFPAHNIVMFENKYFKAQVRGSSNTGKKNVRMVRLLHVDAGGSASRAGCDKSTAHTALLHQQQPHIRHAVHLTS